MKKITVAVLGSCVTRDVFNTRFNKDYKKYYDCILTQNQSSIISIMSDVLEVDDSKLDNLNEYDTWNVKTEFTKSVLRYLTKKAMKDL